MMRCGASFTRDARAIGPPSQLWQHGTGEVIYNIIILCQEPLTTCTSIFYTLKLWPPAITAGASFGPIDNIALIRYSSNLMADKGRQSRESRRQLSEVRTTEELMIHGRLRADVNWLEGGSKLLRLSYTQLCQHCSLVLE